MYVCSTYEGHRRKSTRAEGGGKGGGIENRWVEEGYSFHGSWPLPAQLRYVACMAAAAAAMAAHITVGHRHH